jgi:hypothetical protein
VKLDTLLERRYEKFRQMGEHVEASNAAGKRQTTRAAG